ncbi:TetR/AcrR family transcriptional regulator C-terminal domain-containing protein [Nonomuraea rubra]|uniref:Tetracycline repressor TetR C-terminal domain-containing protein n=1 Tax=Nonomuraea rubra TaxID=46180 RepID=A0A7X0NZP2_9ACTN|nr:TetR/AcrR family transcriptional regulator C-terminal domain-containing protein [Nonomuraea rubra]MBB6552581.1 hypothetical protein [Nonomuraea rubra]
MFAQVELPDPGLPWQEQIRSAALSMYRAFRRHPVVPLALVTDRANPTSVQAMSRVDALVGALYAGGFDDEGAWRALGAVNALVYGSLSLSTGGFAGNTQEHAGAAGVEAYITELNPVALPHFSRLLRWTRGGGVDPEADFTQALDTLIRGLEDS